MGRREVIIPRKKEELVIRLGTPDDINEVMNLALSACDENGFVEPNPHKLYNEIWPALNKIYGMVALIGKPGGQAEGGILLRVGAMWYSDRMVLEEKAVFIHPDFRSARGGRASKLCRFAKEAADILDLPLMIGVLSNQRTEAKVRMYEREFGKPSGAFFLYKANTGLGSGDGQLN
jgi:hypothetical protein